MSIKKNQGSILEGLDLERQVTESLNHANEAIDWEAFKKVVINDPTNKKIQSIASKYGYNADNSYMRSWGDPYVQLSSKDRNDFHPQIYFNDGYAGINKAKNSWKFEIQTTSYGSLDEKEYEKFLKCCQDAYNMIKELSKVDLSKLPQEPKEDK